MRIFKNIGYDKDIAGNKTNSSTITFELTELKYENKVKSLTFYVKNYIKTYFKRKRKIKDCFYTYEFGYKTKEPPLYHFRNKFPLLNLKFNPANVLKFLLADIKNQRVTRLDRSPTIIDMIYYFRGVSITFIYEDEDFTQVKRKKHHNNR